MGKNIRSCIIKLSFTSSVVVFLVLLCFSPYGYAATGGWRTQQANKDIPIVETPPIPGVPYGKDAGTVAEDKSLPPEIKEIDEAIRKDAEVLQRSLHGGSPVSSEELKGGSGSSGGGLGSLGQSSGTQGVGGSAVAGQSGAGNLAPSQGGQTLAPTSASGSPQFSSGDLGKEAGKAEPGKTFGGSTSEKVNIKRSDSAQVKGGDRTSSKVKESDPSGVSTSQEIGLPHKSQSFLWKAVIILAVISVLVIIGKRYVFGGR